MCPCCRCICIQFFANANWLQYSYSYAITACIIIPNISYYEKLSLLKCSADIPAWCTHFISSQLVVGCFQQYFLRSQSTQKVNYKHNKRLTKQQSLHVTFRLSRVEIWVHVWIYLQQCANTNSYAVTLIPNEIRLAISTSSLIPNEIRLAISTSSVILNEIRLASSTSYVTHSRSVRIKLTASSPQICSSEQHVNL